MEEQVPRTDAELLRAAGRDPAAFGELYDRHAAPILRWALRSGLDEADALDLVSELFARAWVSPGRHAEAVRLRVVDGLGYPDIATQLGCTETTARKWVSLGLRSLRTRMEVAS